MRRVGRHIINALTGLSLVLCVATAVLWVRSYRTKDVVTFEDGPDGSFWIETPKGGIQLVREGNAVAFAWGWELTQPSLPLPSHTRFGFGVVARFKIYDTNKHIATHISAIVFPDAAVIIVTAPAARPLDLEINPAPSQPPPLPTMRLRSPRHARSLSRVRSSY